MARYVNVTHAEMVNFLAPMGFVKIALPNTIEIVYAKILKAGNVTISMRIYTGINPDGGSRGVGKDAIRVMLFWKDAEGYIHEVGGSKRVHRVAGWRANLSERIKNWESSLGPSCPKCGAPMVLRTVSTGANKGQQFYGCCMFFKSHCNGTMNTLPLRKAV